jgi:transcriptional regulator GlxA family with amidase domain
MGVTAIAYETGFADATHFSRLFREHVGATPSEWRLRSLPVEVVAN